MCSHSVSARFLRTSQVLPRSRFKRETFWIAYGRSPGDAQAITYLNIQSDFRLEMEIFEMGKSREARTRWNGGETKCLTLRSWFRENRSSRVEFCLSMRYHWPMIMKYVEGYWWTSWCFSCRIMRMACPKFQTSILEPRLPIVKVIMATQKSLNYLTGPD